MRILLFFTLLLCTAHVFGNAGADELRKSMYAAPDSAKAAILLNIAKLYQYENLDSCIYYAQLSSDRAFSRRQYLAMIEAETLLSQIAIEKKNYTLAIRYQRTIRDIAVRERYWDVAMENFKAMALTWLDRKNYAEAVEFLKEGLIIAVDRNNLEMSKYFYLALIESYGKLGNMSNVRNYYDRLIEVTQTIDFQAYNSRIETLQAERETLIAAVDDARNWRQQQMTVTRVFHTLVLILAILLIVALVAAFLWFQFVFKTGIAQSQKEMSEKANQLDRLLKDQEKTFQFLSNHVYASIHALSKSIELFKTKPAKKRGEIESDLNSINKEISALYDFFENLTLLLQVQSGQLKIESTTVNIPNLATNLLVENNNFAKNKNITLVNEVQNNTFAIGDEKLVNAVLRNIMSNALKYAPKGTGRITVGTKIGTRIETMEGAFENAGFIEVWVTDDGTGISQEQVSIMFDLQDNLTIPDKFESKGYGAGLAVCKAVIERLNGRIWAETKPGEGFCMRFNLPRAMDTEVKTQSLVADTQETISTEFKSDNPLLLSE